MIIQDADKWITVKPNGAENKGAHVKIDGETGEVKAEWAESSQGSAFLKFAKTLQVQKHQRDFKGTNKNERQKAE